MISLGGGGSSSKTSSFSSPARVKPAQTNKWRTGTQQKIYGRRLVDALRTTRASSGGAPQPRAVKAAADSALALTAHGQTRWSRAILLSTCRRRRVLVKAGGKIRKRHHRRPTKAPALEPPAALLKETKVNERLRVLGRLVPGCRKLAAPALLEETADYVAALEMQVKTMRALADALAAAQLHDHDHDHGEMMD
ncbi:hypothetical protein QOZ80_1BG0048580 [Eleusine coracana subsp. coracana]|nr:hypothetical protein QOZ80_1BG0048580 [Eleusine coracana subsp. coracana]